MVECTSEELERAAIEVYGELKRFFLSDDAIEFALRTLLSESNPWNEKRLKDLLPDSDPGLRRDAGQYILDDFYGISRTYSESSVLTSKGFP